MSDIVMLAVTTAFFVLCSGYVRWCDHIIGSDPTAPLHADDTVDLDATVDVDDAAAAVAADRAGAQA